MLLVLGGAFVWSLNYRTQYYAITPGLAQPVGPLIKVSGHPHAGTRRTILLTDVYLTQLTAFQWLLAELHPVHEELLNGSQFNGPSVPTSELEAQGYLEMYESQESAKVAAMRALHLHVAGTGAGVSVYSLTQRVLAGDPLRVADRIVAVGGRRVTGFCGLLHALGHVTFGRPISMRVEHADTSSGLLVYGPPTTVSVPSTEVKGVPRTLPCTAVEGVSAVEVPQLGAVLWPSMSWRFPFAVSINTADIGGPSAGLAMTLGVLDALSKVSITGDLHVAATGTISPGGGVGDVGGVAEKTIAVENAGATVFLVPEEEYLVARRAASGGLKVIAVRNLSQAIAAIVRLGGADPVPITDPARSTSRP